MSTVKLSYREAVRAAMRHALATDERVFLMGEDVGGYGGAFAVSMGLLEEFGPERVRERAALRVGVRRRRDRRRARRHAADRRGDDDQLQPARARPDREQRGHAALHVGRADEHPARGADGDRRRPPDGGPARAQPRGLVRAHPGHQGARPGHRRGRARHGAGGARGSRSRLHLRARDALPARRRRSTTSRARSTSRSAAVRREGGDVTVVTYGGSLGSLPRRGRATRRATGSRPR